MNTKKRYTGNYYTIEDQVAKHVVPRKSIGGAYVSVNVKRDVYALSSMDSPYNYNYGLASEMTKDRQQREAWNYDSVLKDFRRFCYLKGLQKNSMIHRLASKINVICVYYDDAAGSYMAAGSGGYHLFIKSPSGVVNYVGNEDINNALHQLHSREITSLEFEHVANKYSSPENVRVNQADKIIAPLNVAIPRDHSFVMLNTPLYYDIFVRGIAFQPNEFIDMIFSGEENIDEHNNHVNDQLYKACYDNYGSKERAFNYAMIQKYACVE